MTITSLMFEKTIFEAAPPALNYYFSLLQKTETQEY